MAHSVGFELGSLFGDDHPSPAAVDPDVAAALRPQPVHQVLEVLEVATLVRGHGNALHVLLDGGGHHFFHAAVVAQVHHLSTLGDEQPADQVDGGVVPVEKAGCGDQPQRVDRDVELAPPFAGRCHGGTHRNHDSLMSNYIVAGAAVPPGWAR